MDIDLITSRRRELAALADEIEKSDRPTRVKIIRLNHICNELEALLAQTSAAIEAVEKAKD
jgi:hypothetical protein